MSNELSRTVNKRDILVIVAVILLKKWTYYPDYYR